MATAAYSFGSSLSGDSIVGAQAQAEGATGPSRPGRAQPQAEEDEDELIEVEGEDDEMDDRKSVEDEQRSATGSPRKVLSFEDELAQSLSTSAPKTQVRAKTNSLGVLLPR